LAYLELSEGRSRIWEI